MNKKKLIEVLNNLGSDDTKIRITTFEGDTEIRCVWLYNNEIYIETNDFDSPTTIID